MFAFDFDGVVVDTKDLCYRLFIESTPHATMDDYIALFHGNIYEELLKLGHTPEFLAKDTERHFRRYAEHILDVPPVDGMRELLSELARSGESVVVTSSKDDLVIEWFKRHGFHAYVSRVMGKDTHHSKREKFRLLFDEHARVPDDCVFVTDTTGDIREAREEGVPSVAVSWGFMTPEMLAKENPFHIAHSVQDLRQAIHRRFLLVGV